MATKYQRQQRTWIILAAVVLIGFLVALSQHYGLTGRAASVPPGLPDLRFINSHDLETDINVAVRISAQIYNDGADFDTPYVVRFEEQTGRNNFTGLGEYTVLDSHAGGTAVTAYTFFSKSEPGTYTIRETIDSGKNVTEYNEANNEVTIKVYVLKFRG
ncbi:MAG: hypothetical protein HYT16_00935 [DPANN group archaeon]|nr:hypothetical protein [DPANN group archaeon]